MTNERAVTAREADADLAHAQVAAIAARLHDAEAELVELAVRVVDGELWAGGGILSPEHWLVLRAGLSPARAHDVTRVAQRWGAMPTLAAAVRAGTVSLDLAAVVAKFVPDDHERSATELAEHATVPQLRRALSRYQFTQGARVAGAAAEEASDGGPSEVSGEARVEDPGDTGADPTGAASPEPAAVVPPLRDPEADRTAGSLAWAVQPPELTMGHTDGRFWVRFSAPSDVGALVEQALLEAKDALFRATTAGAGPAGSGPADGGQAGRPGADEPRVGLGDALIEMANRSLSGVESTSRLQRYRVYVHLSVDGSWVNGRGAIPPSLAARFACDGVVQPVWEVDGAPVSVGRDQRIVPDRSRRLIEDRDRGCRYPGCVATRHVEVHHLDHWAQGGATDLERMLCLCPRDHDAHHRGEFSMEGEPGRVDGVVFRTARGREIGVARPPDLAAGVADPSHPPTLTEPGDRRPPAPEPKPYRGPTGERLVIKWVDLSSNLALDAQDAWRRRIAERTASAPAEPGAG